MRHIPLEMPIIVNAERTNLLRLEFTSKTGGLFAEIAGPDSETSISISFASFETFRVLDEMALSTEDPAGSLDGVRVGHVAYRVEDGYFWRIQSETFRAIYPELSHYQFITGFDCLEVLSKDAPVISVVAR